MRFRSREEAGRLLAARLRLRPWSWPVVLALPRGGMAVGAPIARALGVPLEAFIVRKLGAPLEPELALGALAEGGYSYVDRGLMRLTGTTAEELDQVSRAEERELERRVLLYRQGRPLPSLWKRSVLVVDDGVATGSTAKVAARALRAQHPEELVLVTPVVAASSLPALNAEYDRVIWLQAPVSLRSIGEWYEDFHQVSDAEVLGSLGEEARALEVYIRSGADVLSATLRRAEPSLGLVIFAHGAGSSRKSPRNTEVARVLREAGYSTLLLDLVSEEEAGRGETGFDLELGARRLQDALAWARDQRSLASLPMALYGSSTGAAAALLTASRRPGWVSALISRGGRLDLVREAALDLRVPLLAIVGAEDEPLAARTRAVLADMSGEQEYVSIPGAGHLFEEPGALEEVSALSVSWLNRYLGRAPEARPSP